MEEPDINEYDVERYSAKMFLDFFAFDLYNSFESLADREVGRLIAELDRNNKKHKDLEKEYANEESEKASIEIQSEQYNCFLDIEYTKETIWALIEMKIVYAFKSLELNTKKLIRTAFPGTKTKDFYKWEALVNFLRSRNIIPENLKGFQEITQLKDVNNTLKHSGDFSEDLKNRVPEFKNKQIVSFSDLNTFYSRAKPFPQKYLADLASAIQTELYEFDEQKIDRIANNIARRMEKKDVELLINAIRSKY